MASSTGFIMNISTNNTDLDQSAFNETSGATCFQPFQSKEIIQIVILLIILIGNAFVIVHICVQKTRSRMYFFVAHLAVADLFVALINVLPDLCFKIWSISISYPLLCKFMISSRIIVSYSSTYVHVSLSIDRLLAIVQPLDSTKFRIGHRSRLFIAMAWAVSMVFAIPEFVLATVVHAEGCAHCILDLNEDQWKLKFTLNTVAIFFVPVTIIAICYVIIIHTIWRRGIHIQGGSIAVKATRQRMSQSNPRYVTHAVISRAKIRTVKISLVIISVFTICMSPYYIYNLLDIYGIVGTYERQPEVTYSIQILSPLNSAANPVIYLLLSTKFLTYCRRKQRESPEPENETELREMLRHRPSGESNRLQIKVN